MAVQKNSPQVFAPGQALQDGSLLNKILANPGYSTDYGETATGANLAGALQLAAQITQLAVVAANTGVALAALTAGQSQDIYNDGANPLTVYALAGYTIDGAASVPLANAKRCRYTCLAPGIIESAQLGAVSA